MKKALKEQIDQLTAEQREGFEVLRWRIGAQAGGRFALCGPAGTGKTFLAATLAGALEEDGLQVRLCAPTHKAAEVLREKMGAEESKAKTLQSTLGLKLAPDNEGGYHLVPDGFPSLPEGCVAVCDEASMIGNDLWQHIGRVPGVTWLFLGDRAQLPPVEEDPSPALSLPGAQLTEIVRQAKGNPITEIGSHVRSGTPPFENGAVRYEDGEGVALTPSRGALIDSAERAFRETPGPYAARVLAFRNRTAQEYNRVLRSRLHGAEADPYVRGEWLVAQRTFFQDEIPVVNNSEVLHVESARRERDEMSEGRWLVWRLSVRAARQGEPSGPARHITVLDPGEEQAFGREAEKRKRKAVRASKGGEGNGGASAGALWKRFYEHQEQYASVRYAYAVTVHKSQGSTYETAFVDWADLESAPQDIRQPLQYVAATRASKRLAVYR